MRLLKEPKKKKKERKQTYLWDWEDDEEIEKEAFEGLDAVAGAPGARVVALLLIKYTRKSGH